MMRNKRIYLAVLVLVLSMILTNTQAELIGWWRFDEGSGDVAYDTSGNGLDGTIEGGPQWVVGKIGGALKFDGDDDQITLNDPLTVGSSSNTVTAWVKVPLIDTEGLGATERVGIVLGSYPDSPNSNWELHAEGQIRLWWNGGEIDHRGTTDLRDDIWHHLTWVRDKATNAIYMYIDGQLETTIEDLGTDVTFNTTHKIGGDNRGNPPNWHGFLDDVRIFRRALSPPEILGIMLGEVPPYAWGPEPTDGTLHMDTWINLSWKPGPDAVSHDVYLGDIYDDVNDGTGDTFRGNQTTLFYVAGFPGFAYPEGLVPGTTYYWRIDEVNEANPASPWKGPVWSFSIPPKTAYNPDPADGAEFVDPNDPKLSWTPGFGAKLHTIYFGDNFDEVNNATGGFPQGFTVYAPGPLELEKVYYWRIDEFDAVETYKGDVWSFTTPGAVGNPRPAHNAADVPLNAILSWTPADSAASHEIYFGTDKETVRNGDTGSPEYKGSKTSGAESYDPGLLEANTTYYWRVDEVDSQGNVSTGPLWMFTTSTFVLIDDFESYTDDDAAGQAIWQTWIDGFGIPDNGAQVGYLMPPYAEQTIVHGGAQSMPLLFTNEAGVTNSEASTTLSVTRDWTQASVAELSLWFRGASGNAAEPLYVAISNSAGTPAVVAHDNLDAATTRIWTQWMVPLQAFVDQGINLADVDNIGIGLGTKAGLTAPGGVGTIYVDDIRLSQP